MYCEEFFTIPKTVVYNRYKWNILTPCTAELPASILCIVELGCPPQPLVVAAFLHPPTPEHLQQKIQVILSRSWNPSEKNWGHETKRVEMSASWNHHLTSLVLFWIDSIYGSGISRSLTMISIFCFGTENFVSHDAMEAFQHPKTTWFRLLGRLIWVSHVKFSLFSCKKTWKNNKRLNCVLLYSFGQWKRLWFQTRWHHNSQIEPLHVCTNILWCVFFNPPPS